MSFITIKNQFISATIATKGAELVKLEKQGENYIWDVDTNYWNKTSPVLFPIVGRLKNDTFTFEGKNYQLPRHGFARDYEFEHDVKSENQVIFTLESTDDMLTKYPFNFKFMMAYTLIDNELIIEYLVQNLNDKTMYFSLGAHPAFKIDGDISDYSLEFNKNEPLTTFYLENDLFNGEFQTLETSENDLKLNYQLFEKDALVFKNLQSNEIILKHLDVPKLKMAFEFFPYLGIWTKSNAPFICLEPWCGIADNAYHSGELTDKEGIQLIQPNENFLRAIRIELF